MSWLSGEATGRWWASLLPRPASFARTGVEPSEDELAILLGVGGWEGAAVDRREGRALHRIVRQGRGQEPGERGSLPTGRSCAGSAGGKTVEVIARLV